MYLKEICIFVVFNFLVATAFDYDICKYGKQARNKTYDDKEIQHFCSRFIYEKMQQNARFGVSLMEGKIHEQLNDVRSLDLDLLQKQCKKKKFNTNNCNENKRYEILKEIKNKKINFKNETDIIFLLDRLTFYDFSVFYIRPEYQEIQDFIQTMNGISWDVRITHHHHFLNLLWRLVNIMNNCIIDKHYKLDTMLDILILHENVFTNIIHWKIFNMDDLYRYFFSVPSKICIFGKNNYYLVHRVIKFVNSITSIIENHILWNNEIEKYNFFSYVYFAISLDPEYQANVIGIKKINKDDVLPNKITFNIENVEVIMKYQDGVNLNGVAERLKEVYDKFYQTFGNRVDLTLKKIMKTHVFKSKDEYNYYGGLFRYATNNGGITYHGDGTKIAPMIYYYVETNKIRNLGHEFVHGLLNCYFPLSGDFNALIHEGTAEAIGQRESEINAHIINKIFDDTEVDIDAIRDVDYDSELSPYYFGFVTIKSLIDNGLINELANVLLTKNTCENFTNLVVKHLSSIEYYARNYKPVIIETVDNLFYDKLLDIYRSQKFDDNITVVIDNTFFELKKDYLYMHHNDSSINKYINILADKRYGDIKYFVQFSIKLSLKNIYGYELFYPEIEQKKEYITIYKNNIFVKAEVERERVFNSLFELGNKFKLNPLKEDSNITFSSIKKYIDKTRSVFYNNYQYLSIPNKYTSSDEQEMIYMLNSSPLIDMVKLRKINTGKILDTKNRTIVEIFENFFTRYYFFSRYITSMSRSRGEYYLILNEPVYLSIDSNYRYNQTNNIPTINPNYRYNQTNNIPTIKPSYRFNQTNNIPAIKPTNTTFGTDNLETRIQNLIKTLNYDIDNKYKLLENNIYVLKKDLSAEIQNSKSSLLSLIMNIRNKQEIVIKNNEVRSNMLKKTLNMLSEYI